MIPSMSQACASAAAAFNRVRVAVSGRIGKGAALAGNGHRGSRLGGPVR